MHPNPASEAVSVRLGLGAPATSAVIAVCDAQGRRVAVLYDGPLPPGPHDFAFETAGVPAGVYLVRADGLGVPAAVSFTVVR